MDCNIELRNHLCNHFSAERIGKLAYLRFLGRKTWSTRLVELASKKSSASCISWDDHGCPLKAKGFHWSHLQQKGSHLGLDFCRTFAPRFGEKKGAKFFVRLRIEKNASGSKKTSPKQIRRKNIPKGIQKVFIIGIKKWFHSRNCAGDSVMCIFCPIKRIQKKIFKFHFRGVQKVATFPPRDPSSMMRGSEGSTWRFKKTTAIFCSLADIF